MKLKVLFFISFLFSLMNFSIISVASVSEASKIISAYGNIVYNDKKFVLCGACVAYNHFVPEARNYQPRIWEILEDLGVNYINVWGGIEGDINHLNIINYPDEWAENLDKFLEEAYSHGIKVVFYEMGNRWNSLFGINSPGSDDRLYIPIDEAKLLVDKLAGDNNLGHNFITDFRVLGWKTVNEPDIANETIFKWNIELCNYIHNKGGIVWMASPRYGSWERQDFSTIEPLIGKHVDFLERHMYELKNFITMGSNYTAFLEFYKNKLRTELVEGRGNFTIDDVILGEFGIWRGYGEDMGVDGTFTDENRRDYYNAVFDAAKEVGIKNVCFYDLFARIYPDPNQVYTNYDIIDENGNYYPYLKDIIKSYYMNP